MGEVAGYTRKFSEKGGINIEFDKFTVDSSDKDTGGNVHNTVSGSGSLKGNFTATGINTWTDELKVGDEVILNEFKNQKKFYLVDKAYYYKVGE